MKIDGGLMGSLHQVPERIRALEQAGYDGAITAETSNDPFFPLVLAAEHSEKIDLITSIAVAFARSPMNLAQIGHDLNAYSEGRFILGLGSQIKPHITKRFSMPWSSPAARMRELILAMRAVWDCWYKGEKLEFRGEFYTHTLMTPMFTPAEKTYGAPRVFLAAVGPLMTRVAGEVADGIIAHAFTTARYLREVTLPAIDEGLERTGRTRSDIEVTCPVFVVTGADEESWSRQREAVTRQIAFYGSTPAYKPVLELHGWGALQGELNRLSKQGKWAEMGTLISDEMLEEFAVVAEPGRVAGELKSRYGDMLDRVVASFDLGEHQADAIEELKKP
ncbi:MAG: LLM class F420-dependent oxidoreductase [Deltaproteobacteria bacterium]|nr:LLM class F420-dependent oxidoreductase [Deltaproteobacteria bacterium]MBW2416046.1 LLM class F420-dependent oxidoreductase [Deltaproteobacteria bacterium]